MVVNTLAAAVSARRRELGQLRLTGATPAQVRAVLVWEGVVVAATGIAVGSIASLGTILPYSWVKLDRLLPDLGPAYAVMVAAAAVAVVLASTVGATRRALRPAALEAVVTAAG
jgi:putative ABC transport system permease protein